MKRVLLTGANGFIGRQVIAPLLELGCEVHVTTRVPLGMSSVHEHHVDLFDAPAVSHLLGVIRPSHLIHLAWYTQPPDYWQSSLNTTWVSKSVHLFESFVRNGGERLVGVGTCAEYEWGATILQEGTTPERPATPYGSAKLSLHHLGAALAREKGISFAWARFFFLFGAQERKERFVSSIIDPLLRADVAYCRNGDLIRDFLYVEDAGHALSALMQSDVQGAVNVASGVALQLGAVAAAIGTTMRLPDLVHVGTEDAATTQPKSLVADVTRLCREVGWMPRFGLHEAIERTIALRTAQRRLNAI